MAPIDYELFLKDNYSEIALDSCKQALEFPKDDVVVEFRDKSIRTVTPVLLDSKFVFLLSLSCVKPFTCHSIRLPRVALRISLIKNKCFLDFHVNSLPLINNGVLSLI